MKRLPRKLKKHLKKYDPVTWHSWKFQQAQYRLHLIRQMIESMCKAGSDILHATHYEHFEKDWLTDPPPSDQPQYEYKWAPNEPFLIPTLIEKKDG